MELREKADTAYEVARSSILQRYSENSQAYAALSYAQLIHLLTSAAESNQDDAWELAKKQLRVCQEQLWNGFRTRDRSHIEVLDESIPLLQFRETSTVRLPRPRIAPETMQLDAGTLMSLQAGSHYLYVLSPRDEIFIHTRPLSIADLFFPNAHAVRINVRHPQISPNGNPVQSAGELCVLRGQHATAVLFNTRSGHYQPPPASAFAMRKACLAALKLDEQHVFQLVLGPRSKDAFSDGR